MNAKFFGAAKIFYGFLFHFVRLELRGEIFGIEAGLICQSLEGLKVGGVLVFEIEISADGLVKFKAFAGVELTRRHHRPAGGFGIQDKSVTVEKTVVKFRAGGFVDVFPMAADARLIPRLTD